MTPEQLARGEIRYRIGEAISAGVTPPDSAMRTAEIILRETKAPLRFGEYVAHIIAEYAEGLLRKQAALYDPVEQPALLADGQSVMKWLDTHCARVGGGIDSATFEISDEQAFALVTSFLGPSTPLESPDWTEDKKAEFKTVLADVFEWNEQPSGEYPALPANVERDALAQRLIGEVIEADAIATAVCQGVAELPDRNSPEDWPEAMLVTDEELHMIVREAVFDAQGQEVLHATPQQTVTVTYDLSPAETDDAIRARLIDLGWTPPASVSNDGGTELPEALIPQAADIQYLAGIAQSHSVPALLRGHITAALRWIGALESRLANPQPSLPMEDWIRQWPGLRGDETVRMRAAWRAGFHAGSAPHPAPAADSALPAYIAALDCVGGRDTAFIAGLASLFPFGPVKDRLIAVAERRTADSAARTSAKGHADTIEVLENLTKALNGAFISTWQSTAAWQQQLDDAREHLLAIKETPHGE